LLYTLTYKKGDLQGEALFAGQRKSDVAKYAVSFEKYIPIQMPHSPPINPLKKLITCSVPWQVILTEVYGVE